jgi:polysaccharide biosynthesis protein PslG
MQMTTSRNRWLLLWLLSLMLVACAPQEPIRIIITPTHAPTEPVENTVVPTSVPVTATPTETATLLDAPSATNTALGAIPTVSGGTSTSDAALITATTAGNFGPILATDYQLPPTSTPRPTLTSTPANTPIVTRYPEYPALDGNRMGIQAYYNLTTDVWYSTLLQARGTNMGWIKLQANWAFIQPDGPDQRDGNFQLFVEHVRRAKDVGFKVMLSVAKAPVWARSTTQDEDGPPDDLSAYTHFIEFLLLEIGEGRVDAVEIWNEPNLIREWRGTLPFDGAGYMQLFRPAYDTIKAFDPNIVVVTAGLAPTGDSDGSVDDRTFLQQMYSAGLAQYEGIAIGFHPYSWGNPPDFLCCDHIPDRGWDDDPHFFFANTLQDYRKLMTDNGDSNLQLWATEFGWATWENYPSEPPDVWMTYNSEQDQLEYTVRAFEIGQSLDYMGPMFLWNLNFGGADLINNSVEMAGYTLNYQVEGQAATNRPLFDILAQITKLQ